MRLSRFKKLEIGGKLNTLPSAVGSSGIMLCGNILKLPPV